MTATAAATAAPARPAADAMVEVRTEVRPPWPFRLPRRNGMDGLTRTRNGVLHRLLHVGSEPVIVRVAQPAPDRVLFGARCADRDAAASAIARMRQALGVDLDLRPFYERFRSDPLIGRSVRENPTLRVTGRAEPFEALAWAICEQLIEYERAAAIQRRLIARLGRRCPTTGLRDSPSAAVLAGQAPALLASFDLAPKRALTLIRVAREVAAGRVQLDHPDHERGWRRLRAISGVGSWTLQSLALVGQGRMDQIPAGDLAYIKLVGRLTTGDPRGRATEEEVDGFFAPYAPWAGLAGLHALRSAGSPTARRLTAA
ncbi:MAG TPA: AlkA N-terminal domain-containing protein [Solirubrobacteraceae bacterium]|nr:AlkA N-terminal domain-containing protein [Solirubrobacteraceae bacterium]